MLVDVIVRETAETEVFSHRRRTIRLQKGVYQSYHYNFELEFRRAQAIDLDFPDLEDNFNSYGVADSVEQILAALPSEVIDGPRQYVLNVVQVRREDQHPEGGWRWHKWGAYIGTRVLTHEYLYDESEIEEVWCYQVYQVK